MLQTDKCLVVFEDWFRPWPHVFKNGLRSKLFYKRVDANLSGDLEKLRTYQLREDRERYEAILREILRLFGEGIIASLEYTMGDYLSQTNGALCNNNKEGW